MARIPSSIVLDEGSAFPAMTLHLVDGESLALPPETGRWTIVLVYRGNW